MWYFSGALGLSFASASAALLNAADLKHPAQSWTRSSRSRENSVVAWAYIRC